MSRDGKDQASGFALTRRQVLQAMGVAGAGLWMGACATTVKEPAKTAVTAGPAGTPAVPKELKLKLTGWNYQQDYVRKLLDKYEQSHAGTKIDFDAHASAQYNEKAIALFLAKSPMDVVYGRDGVWPGWADAGYIQPIDGLPGLDAIRKDLFDFHLQGTLYKGKMWGVPYYGDFMSFGYDAGVLEKVGVKSAPTTWDDIKNISLEIKKAGILDTPVMIPMGSSAVLHWWTMIFGSGGSLIDENGQALFTGKDGTALAALEWLVQAANDWKILDLSTLQGSTESTRTNMMAGQYAFITAPKYDFKAINDPKQSKIAGRAKPMLVPTFAKGKTGTCGWVRIYCLSSSVSDKPASWELIKYLGSPENARDWYLNFGIGYAYKSLDKDTKVVESTKEWGDVSLFEKQGQTARIRQGLNEKWFAEWEVFNQQQIQNAILKQISPKDALAESARKLDEIKKKY
jgi:multiple sugar transport system substrate-binding protein